MSTFTPLSTLLAARSRDADRVRFDVPHDWLQGRTSFGGLISVMAVQAMRDVAGSAWPADVKLRALQTSFIGPVTQGPVEVVVNLLREGKNVRQVQALVQQAGQTAALLLGVFGNERETSIAPLSPKRPPVATEPEQTPVRPLPAGVVPHFTQHMDMRFVGDGAPFSGRPSNTSCIHLQLRGEPASGIATELLTVLLADVPPTPLLSQFSKPTPASSVSWELELRPLAQATEGWWRVDTEVLAAAGGYSNQATHLWSPDGELAALGYQVVTVYG
ncbi:MAG: thioesterase family protein [Cytophagales bacterium]|nr:thioesterase family protein [Rhizobacter sp.]